MPRDTQSYFTPQLQFSVTFPAASVQVRLHILDENHRLKKNLTIFCRTFLSFEVLMPQNNEKNV